MVIYLPLRWTAKDGDHSRGRQGTWYGRVEPKHVAGIIQGLFMPWKLEPRVELASA